jgi:hypothetical protein
MDKPRIRESHGPEWKIQQKLIRFLRARKWLVEVTQGNLYQKGFPDLYLSHVKFGQRWIDVKNPVAYTFTKAQRIKWPDWEKHGVGIWILVAPTEEEYDKIFQPPNWRKYWKPKWDLEPTVDELLEELGYTPPEDLI